MAGVRGRVRRRAVSAALTSALALTATGGLVAIAPAVSATPVCTDGFNGGPPRGLCGGRIFPEAAIARSYVQYTADPSGFREYADGLLYLEKLYPRWVDVFTLDEWFKDPAAVTAGPDGVRSDEPTDSDDGRKIWVVRLTDKTVPDKDKKKLFFSLSVHGNERGGLEGGLRTAEDLAMQAEAGTGSVPDGVANYDSATGKTPEVTSYPPAELLARTDTYLVDFNIDGWEQGDTYTVPTSIYGRANGAGTDLNRQMPTQGSINLLRNPLKESEMRYGTRFMQDLARQAGGLMSYGADVHGELTSRAYVESCTPPGSSTRSSTGG